MAGQTEALTLEKSKNKYLGQDRSVNLQKHLDKQEKIQKSGLEGIEIRDRAKQLGKDDFLQLLVKQLTHQDPTSPIKDQAFIAQMAQFSSLEQMQNMTASINKMSDRQAMDLVGKFIMGKDFVSGEPVTGVARALFFDNAGQPFLKVSGKNVAIKDVNLIGDPSNFKREFGGTAPATAPAASAPRQNPAIAPAGQQPMEAAGNRTVPGAAPANLNSAGTPAEKPSESKAKPAPSSVKPHDQVKAGETGEAARPEQTKTEPKSKPVSFMEMTLEHQAGGAFRA